VRYVGSTFTAMSSRNLLSDHVCMYIYVCVCVCVCVAMYKRIQFEFRVLFYKPAFLLPTITEVCVLNMEIFCVYLNGTGDYFVLSKYSLYLE
jgi:hypothetical protein